MQSQSKNNSARSKAQIKRRGMRNLLYEPMLNMFFLL